MMKGGSWALRFCVIAAAFAPYPANFQQTQDGCGYLPTFQTLRTQLPSLPPDQAAALAGYVASHDNLESCEFSEIDRLMAEQEVTLFWLVAGKTWQPAQAVYRCNQFDPRIARCEGPMMDGTAFPRAVGIYPLAIPDSRQVKSVSELPEASLAAIYRTSLADALGGKAATLLNVWRKETRLTYTANSKFGIRGNPT
ncbi:hypothetical protein ANRL3_00217 [Anaerolineae bacterium]|nr:hypothetical protein ANRL3_00217 [Anaerolineae bacterium]